jgi:uncharacterized protein YndB with AHSA1/START domain
VTAWNFASEDWFCPSGEADFVVWGKFSYTMSAKDDSIKFDFFGVYTHIEDKKCIEYTMWDILDMKSEETRTVRVEFMDNEEWVKLIEYFSEKRTMKHRNLLWNYLFFLLMP